MADNIFDMDEDELWKRKELLQRDLRSGAEPTDLERELTLVDYLLDGMEDK